MKKKNTIANATGRATAGRDRNRYPKGLDRRKVQAIIDHYEKQTDDQAVAEDEAAYRSVAITMIGVPVQLVPRCNG
jgi:hypothetical protein